MTPHEPCGRREAIAVRRDSVLALRVNGKSHSAIAREVGAGETTVRNDLRAALAKLAENTLNNAAELRALEVARLDRLERKLSAKLESELSSNELIRFAETLVRVSESRRRLLGLDLGGGSTFNTINAGSAGIVFNIVRDDAPAIPVPSRVVEALPSTLTEPVAELESA